MTLKDIAEKAGVSMMTVSNVINGKHQRVSPRTIEKVNAIIKECGYVPNLNARSLMSKSSNIIGIIISWDDPDTTENYLENCKKCELTAAEISIYNIRVIKRADITG